METAERERRIAAARKFHAKQRAVTDKAKSVPCVDCGVSYPPWVMDLDHRDPSIKCFHVSQAMSRSTKALLAEIAKCDPVCSNCHRQRTYVQSHGGKI